jgi:EmrB/QacA subfamily drug resistance transporter
MTNIKNTKWWIFVGAGLMIFLVNVDATIVNLALAKIAKSLHTDLAQTQWIINAYLFTTAIFFIVGGKLSDSYGTKPIFLIGTIFFGIASLIAGLAPNIDLLIIARLFQGIGFAFTLSLALLMISSSFPLQQRGFALGLAVTLTGLGQATGPTIGGIILHILNWHWIFLINIPITLASFLIIYNFAKRTLQLHEKPHIDYLGVILFGAAILTLLLTFNVLTHSVVNIPLFFSGILASLFLLFIFYFQERKTKNPLIDFNLFSQRNYSLSLAIRFFFMYIYGTFLFFIPLYLQNILGFNALSAGLLLLFYSACYGLTAPIAGLWADKVGYRFPIIIASLLCFAGFVFLSLITPKSSIFLVLFGMMFFGIASALLIPCTVNSTLSSLPQKSAGEGLGMFFTIAFIGTAMGVAISGVQLNFVSWHNFLKLLPHFSISNTASIALRHTINGTQSIDTLSPYLARNELNSLVPFVKQSFLKGFVNVMILNAILSLLIAILSITLKSEQQSKDLQNEETIT